MAVTKARVASELPPQQQPEKSKCVAILTIGRDASVLVPRKSGRPESQADSTTTFLRNLVAFT